MSSSTYFVKSVKILSKTVSEKRVPDQDRRLHAVQQTVGTQSEHEINEDTNSSRSLSYIWSPGDGWSGFSVETGSKVEKSKEVVLT